MLAWTYLAGLKTAVNLDHYCFATLNRDSTGESVILYSANPKADNLTVRDPDDIAKLREVFDSHKLQPLVAVLEEVALTDEFAKPPKSGERSAESREPSVPPSAPLMPPVPAEPPKAVEPPKVEEPPKPEPPTPVEPPKAEEPPKVEEPKPAEPPKAEEPAPVEPPVVEPPKPNPFVRR